MIANTHPITEELSKHPQFSFHLIGSRLVEKVRQDDPYTDWDFLVDGSGPHSVEKYKQEMEEIEAYLLGLGFQEVLRGGYSEDTGVSHYQWKGEGQASVDVLITRYEGEFGRRMQLMRWMKRNYGELRKALRGKSAAWGELFALLKDWKSSPLLQT